MSTEDDPFDLVGELGDFERKLAAHIAKKNPPPTKGRPRGPSLLHLRNDSVRDDIRKVLDVQSLTFSYHESTKNYFLAMRCRCSATASRLMGVETVAAMRTEDDVNAVFRDVDVSLRAQCQCKVARKPLGF